MKTTCILLLAAIPLLAACNQENMLENTDNDGTDRLVPMTFTAAIPQTRTELADGNNVHWTNGDRIAIWDGISESEFTATDINGSSATFTGQVTEGSQAYTAFYPYDLVTEMNSTSFTFNLPAEQTATAGTFANGLAPSWAQATDGSSTLTFQNLCALVKFTVASDMAGEGTFTLVGANATEPLAGSLIYTIENSTLTAADNAATHVTLSGTFEAEQTYYFVVAPGTLKNGFSLLYENSKSKYFYRTSLTNVTLTAGRILNLGEINLSKVDKLEAITNTAFIEAVGTQVNWMKTSDGIVLLTDKNKAVIAQVSILNVSGKGLTDLSGLEYFTGLAQLYCENNQLTSLDVSKLTRLEKLWCSNNQLTSLNVSRLTRLMDLQCSNNFLTSLVLGEQTALTNLSCSSNQLASLNVSRLIGLTSLHCNNNNLTSLNVSGLTKLVSLDCNNNQLPLLDVSTLTGLVRLDCNNNQLTSLVVGEQTGLTYLSCSGNQLTSLNVSGLTGLISLSCVSNNLSSLDVSGLPELTYLYCNDNNLSLLDVSELPELMTLYCYNNQLPLLDVSTLTGLISLDCNNNQLTSLVVGKQAKLYEVNCNDNFLTSLDVSTLTGLHGLYCCNNQLTSLDITKLASLDYLICGFQKNGKTLKLTLTSSQQSTWDDKWKSDYYNSKVTPFVQD